MENNQNQDKKKTIKYVLTLSFCVLCLVIVVFAVTYAYFAPRVEGVGKEWNLGAGIAKLKMTGGKIEVTNALPIYAKDKNRKAFKQEVSITLTEDSNLDSCFQIDLDIHNIGSNLRNKYFKYEFYRKDEDTPIKSGSFGDADIVYTEETVDTEVDGTTVTKTVTKAAITLVEKEELSSNEETTKIKDIKDYKLLIWFEYDPVEDQSDYLLGDSSTREFSASIHAHGLSGSCKSNEKPIIEDDIENNENNDNQENQNNEETTNPENTNPTPTE